MPRAVLLGAVIFVLTSAPLVPQAASTQRDDYLQALNTSAKVSSPAAEPPNKN